MIDIDKYINEFEEELQNIFSYWSKDAIDEESGQFYGSIDHFGKKDSKANKGIIMYTRQLWSFSAAALHYNSEEYRKVADTCYGFLQEHFYDQEHGGYFWETDHAGSLIDDKKQTYAQAFALYALTEYFKLTKSLVVLKEAEEQFECIIKKCFDEKTGGYLESFDRKWNYTNELRLSEKDDFADKSMNTNLHILEALTSYHEISQNEDSFNALKRVILDFSQYIIGADKHLVLFMDKSWKQQSTVHSYGHDIEASWLLWEGAEVLGDEILLQHVKVLVLDMVEIFMKEGLDNGCAVLNEKDFASGYIDADRHWWPQCEGLEGLANAYGLTGDKKYLQAMLKIWDYVRENLIDRENGEWYYKVDRNNVPLTDEDKGGMWKTPYHNGRALMRLVQRFKLDVHKKSRLVG